MFANVCTTLLLLVLSLFDTRTHSDSAYARAIRFCGDNGSCGVRLCKRVSNRTNDDLTTTRDGERKRIQ